MTDHFYREMITNTKHERLPKQWALCFSLLAIYAPYCFLLVITGWPPYWIKFLPILPGMAMAAIIPRWPAFAWLPSNPDGALLYTALWFC